MTAGSSCKQVVEIDFKRVTFLLSYSSSNMHDPEGGSFQLYTVKLDGSNLKQITTEAEWGAFNAFPMFGGPDKNTLVWCSSRGTKQQGDINVWKAHLNSIL
jgi:hypothetical protein